MKNIPAFIVTALMAGGLLTAFTNHGAQAANSIKMKSLVSYFKGKKVCPVKRVATLACKASGTVGKKNKTPIPAKGKTGCIKTSKGFGKNKSKKIFFYGQLQDGTVFLCRNKKLLLTTHASKLKSTSRQYTITKNGKLRLHPAKGEPPNDAVVE